MRPNAHASEVSGFEWTAAGVGTEAAWGNHALQVAGHGGQVQGIIERSAPAFGYAHFQQPPGSAPPQCARARAMPRSGPPQVGKETPARRKTARGFAGAGSARGRLRQPGQHGPRRSDFTICSVAQSRSAGVAACIHSTWSADKPSWASPAWGCLGGQSGRCAPPARTAGRAGPSRRHCTVRPAAGAIRSGCAWASHRRATGGRVLKTGGHRASSGPPSSEPRQMASATGAGARLGRRRQKQQKWA